MKTPKPFLSFIHSVPMKDLCKKFMSLPYIAMLDWQSYLLSSCHYKKQLIVSTFVTIQWPALPIQVLGMILLQCHFSLLIFLFIEVIKKKKIHEFLQK